VTITSCVIALCQPERDRQGMTETQTTQATAINRLRLVLRANAATSITGGAIALFAGSWVSRELGIDHVVVTRLLGAGLIVFALQVLMLSRAKDDRVVAESLLISLADAAWVLGTVVVILSGVLSTTGNIVAGLIGLAVGDFGATQFWLRTRATAASTSLRPVTA